MVTTIVEYLVDSVRWEEQSDLSEFFERHFAICVGVERLQDLSTPPQWSFQTQVVQSSFELAGIDETVIVQVHLQREHVMQVPKYNKIRH